MLNITNWNGKDSDSCDIFAIQIRLLNDLKNSLDYTWEFKKDQDKLRLMRQLLNFFNSDTIDVLSLLTDRHYNMRMLKDMVKTPGIHDYRSIFVTTFLSNKYDGRVQLRAPYKEDNHYVIEFRIDRTDAGGGDSYMLYIPDYTMDLEDLHNKNGTICLEFKADVQNFKVPLTNAHELLEYISDYERIGC